jgi:hypothetical protein
MSDYYYFNARIWFRLDYDDKHKAIPIKSLKIMKKNIAEFCESMLAKVDVNIDFYIFEFPNEGLINPIKLITGDEIEPYTGNLVGLGEVLIKQLHKINLDNYYNFYDGIGNVYISFNLKGNDHWDYNFCKASEYFSQLNPVSEGYIDINGYSPYLENEIINTTYLNGNYYKGFMVKYSEGEIYHSGFGYLFIPEVFRKEWYEDNSALRNKIGKNYHKIAETNVNKTVKTELKSEKTINKIKDKGFLFTGTLSSFERDEAIQLVEKNGGKVVSGVNSKLNYLVVGEDPGSKLEKAKANPKIVILSEQEFLEMVNEASVTIQSENPGNLTFFDTLNAELGFTKRENPKYNLVIEKILRILDKAIDKAKDSFSEYNFTVDSYDLYYLDGDYDYTIYGWVHNLMCETEIYLMFLNKRCEKMLRKMLNEGEGGIFGLDEEDKDFEEIQCNFLDRIYTDSITFVGRKLISLGYKLSEEYDPYLED